MPRIYLPALSVTDNRIVLDSEKAHYLSTVLRCKEGDELTIFDGKGNCFTTVIARADKREVIAEVLRHFPCDFESPVRIILVQGLLKGEKMDWVIQKTTELGVREIIPVITETESGAGDPQGCADGEKLRKRPRASRGGV